jgi:Flp pilus assembly protein CpaB
MNLKPILSLSCYFLRLTLTSIVALGLVAASAATVSADPQPRKHKKKYVLITGSNIPVPAKEAKGPLPKTSVPIRSYSADEMRKMGAQTPAEALANDPNITISGRH